MELFFQNTEKIWIFLHRNLLLPQTYIFYYNFFFRFFIPIEDKKLITTKYQSYITQKLLFICCKIYVKKKYDRTKKLQKLKINI